MFLTRIQHPIKRKDSKMLEVKDVLESSLQLNFVPKHNCKQNLEVIEKTHSVNSLHNIVIAR